MKILKNYLYNMSFQILAIIIPLVTVPYISRVLGSEAVGINAYTNAIMTYFVMIANVGLTVYGNRAISYSRDSLEERSQKFWEIVSLKLIMASISILLLFAFISIYGKYSNYLILQSIQIISAAFDISWFFTGLEDFKKTVTRNIIVKIVSAILILTLVKDVGDLSLYILIVTLSTLLGNLTLWTYLRKMIKPIRLSQISLHTHLVPVFVLFVPQLATQLFMTMNKLILGNLSTLSQTGYFDNADKIVRILLPAIVAVGAVIFPRIANSYKRNNSDEVQKYLMLAFDSVNLISFPIVFGLISINTEFSTIYFGPDFIGIDLVLGILVIELLFMGWSSVLGNQFLVAIDKTKGLTVSVIIGTFVLVLTSIFLIPQFGAAGAALTSVVGEMVIALIQIYYVKKYVEIGILFREIPKYLLASITMFIIVFLVNSLPLGNFTMIVIKVLVGGLVYLSSLYLLKPRILSESVVMDTIKGKFKGL